MAHALAQLVSLRRLDPASSAAAVEVIVEIGRSMSPARGMRERRHGATRTSSGAEGARRVQAHHSLACWPPTIYLTYIHSPYLSSNTQCWDECRDPHLGGAYRCSPRHADAARNLMHETAERQEASMHTALPSRTLRILAVSISPIAPFHLRLTPLES